MSRTITDANPMSLPPLRYGSGLLLAALAMACATAARAGEVRQAVKARPGELVLVRSVPTRIADRPAPPGRALLIDPTPRREVAAALGSGQRGGELTDAEYAALDSGPAPRGLSTLQTQTAALSRNLGNGDGATRTRAGSVGGTLSPLGAVGASARGAGEQVRQALSALPFPTAPTGQPGGG